MTVKELKKVLRKVPKNTEVYMSIPKSLYEEDIRRVTIEHENKDNTTFVVLHSSFSIDT